MIFSEIYGSYFNAVAQILTLACAGELDNACIYDIVERKGFAESSLNIPKAIKNEWLLLNDNNKTPLSSAPYMPLTTLQKRWIKAITLDRRFCLFGIDINGLEDVKPLFTPDTFVYYDRYTDGDDFDNTIYKNNFKTIIKALRTGSTLCIFYENRKGEVIKYYRTPYKLEYSPKDDKFRLLSISNSSRLNIFNLRQINYCMLANGKNEINEIEDETRVAEIIITDERNALERVMLAFSHMRKESTQLDLKHYKLKLYYSSNDETEILIRLLSFGDKVKLLSPDSLLSELKKRIFRQ